MRTTRSCTVMTTAGVVAGVVLWASVASAQNSAPPSDPPASPPSAPLGGPSVKAPEIARTLIKQDFSGNFVRLSEPIEEAALRVLTLSAEEQTKTDEIVRNRAAEMDEGVRKGIPHLLIIAGIREEGITRDRQQAIRELSKLVPSVRDRQPYRNALIKALSPEHAKEFERVMDEYFRAAIAAATKEAQAEGRKGNPIVMSLGESLRISGTEVQASYERIVGSGQEKLDRLIEVAQPDAAQEAKIRAITTEYAQKTLGSPTPAQKVELARELAKILSLKQREAVFREWYGTRESPAAPSGTETGKK